MIKNPKLAEFNIHTSSRTCPDSPEMMICLASQNLQILQAWHNIFCCCAVKLPSHYCCPVNQEGKAGVEQSLASYGQICILLFIDQGMFKDDEKAPLLLDKLTSGWLLFF